LVFFVSALGCNGDGIARVSGKVTLNGKPLANADVHFQPIGSKNNPNPGPGSHGKTDANGNYTLRLQTDEDRLGAVVGKHRVMIYAYERAGPQSDAGSPKLKDKVPLRYNEKSELTCDVPKDGRSDADFALQAP
jgi:hypothetical protein